VSFVPRTRRATLWRSAFAAAIVVTFAAATTAVAGLLQVKQIIHYLNLTPPLKHARVTLPAPGAPQTLLLIGSDHRAGTPYNTANTDTMMLVRIDDSSSTINLLSIPRDLQVQLPDGTSKLNAAYSEGGPNLLIRTLQAQVFPGLVVNHILDVNFGGFVKLVNAIGCVYTDVDHRYYNNTALTDFSSIDIEPGYQKLCGTQALSFVRFRHTDSDIVRNARQQAFLRWAKDQYSVGELLSNEDKLLKIFGSHVQTDASLHSVDGLIELFDLAINADAHAIKDIPFPAVFGPCGGSTTANGTTAVAPCYVLASSAAAEQQAYRQFMTPTPAPTARAVGEGRPHKSSPPSTAGLAADLSDGRSQAGALGHLALPVYVPKLIQSGSQYCSSVSGNCDDPEEPASEYGGSYPRAYAIHSPGGVAHPSYVMTLVINSALGEYYAVQGTTWQRPPILNNPSYTTTVGGKLLRVYKNGSHVSLVAWHTPRAVYWISNSLIDTLSNAQMLRIAASLTRA
jgi:polyisoprenyl-teichoic acid--peptidoglycan teichoic acid transferase